MYLQIYIQKCVCITFYVFQNAFWTEFIFFIIYFFTIRLLSVEELSNQLQSLDLQNVPTQAFIRVLNKKPGLKDTNFQVLKARLDAVKYLAMNCPFTKTCGDCIINDVTEKLGDPKNGALAGDVLSAIADATSLSYVSLLVIENACAHKSPKVTQEALLWLSTAMKEFGFV